MSEIKDRLTALIQSQPEDASFDEILKELAFERMVLKGLNDSEKDRVISNNEMQRRIRSWQN